MRLIFIFAFVAAVAVLGTCSKSGGAQVAPETRFTSASQALGSMASRWNDVETGVDGAFLKAQRAAEAVVRSASDAASKERALGDALDTLRMTRTELGFRVLRTELVHRDNALAGAFFEDGFGRKDRDQVNRENTSRAQTARQRILDAYERSAKAVRASAGR